MSIYKLETNKVSLKPLNEDLHKIWENKPYPHDPTQLSRANHIIKKIKYRRAVDMKMTSGNRILERNKPNQIVIEN